MKSTLIALTLVLVSWTASDVENRVLQQIQQMMQESGGRVTFSELHNDERFGPAEKAFLGRLYEVFFQVPALLLRHHEATGNAPTRSEIGANFAISPRSVELLLRVMESDRRVPPLFEREPSSREISSLNLENIRAFLAARGDQVRVTQWEGQPLPSFDLETFDGGRITNSDLNGQNALIYFWFTGCPPCVRIAPILSGLDREHGSDFKIVGFNADHLLEIEVSDEVRRDYLAKSQTRYVNAHLDEATRKAFGSVNVYPTLFFVNQEGTIVGHLLNFQEKSTLETTIREMLGQP